MIELRNIKLKISEYAFMKINRARYKKAIIDKKLAESMLESLNNLLNANIKNDEKNQILATIELVQSLLFQIDFFLIQCEGKFEKIKDFKNEK